MGPDDTAARLLIVPGLGLDARSWAPTVRHLRRPADVLVLPGYGRPAARSADLSPAALAEAVLADGRLRQGAERGPIVLAGHSSGCQVAAHVAALAPRLVDRLVLVAPTTDPRSGGWVDLAQRWLRTAAHEDPRQVPLLAQQYAVTGLRVMARAMDAARRDRIDAALAQVPCPVLVVRGPQDRICPPDWAGSLARTVTLDGGGHMVPWTQGRAVARCVENFVGDPGTTQGGPPL